MRLGGMTWRIPRLGERMIERLRSRSGNGGHRDGPSPQPSPGGGAGAGFSLPSPREKVAAGRMRAAAPPALLSHDSIYALSSITAGLTRWCYGRNRGSITLLAPHSRPTANSGADRRPRQRSNVFMDSQSNRPARAPSIDDDAQPRSTRRIAPTRSRSSTLIGTSVRNRAKAQQRGR